MLKLRCMDRFLFNVLTGSGKNSGPDESLRLRREVILSEQEKKWREEACDYRQRYCGHCNTTTDIKEANFFGRYLL